MPAGALSENPPPVRLGDLAVRLATALVLGAATVALVLWGRVLGLAAGVALVGVLAASELYAMTRREHRLPNEVFGVAAVAVMPFAAAIWGFEGLTAALAGLVAAALLWHVVFRQVTVSDTAITVFGAVYVGFTLSHVVLMRRLDAGTILVLALVVSVWANDVFAYLAGSSFGRHKLAPRISPHKSWEGLVAGTVFTVAVWVGVGYLADIGLTLAWSLAIGVAVSLAAIVGDLAESRIKREVGVKDSGRLLPGHGGFLDRYDSLFLVSVVAFYVLVLSGAR